MLAGLGLLMMMAGASCAGAPRGKVTSGLDMTNWTRKTGDRPYMIARAYYAPPEVTDQLLEKLGDSTTRAGKSSRMGDGTIAIGVLDSRGKPLPAVQCGGSLVVRAAEGIEYQLYVENWSDVPVEFVPLVDGLQLDGAPAKDFSSPGRLIPARGRTVFTTRADAAGREQPLRFRAVTDAGAVTRSSPYGTLGSLVVAAFLGEGSDAFDTPPPLARRRTPRAAGAAAASLPGGMNSLGRASEPMLLPYQYF